MRWEEAREMFETVKKALTKGKISGQNLIINTNVIQEFMIPRSKIAVLDQVISTTTYSRGTQGIHANEQLFIYSNYKLKWCRNTG